MHGECMQGDVTARPSMHGQTSYLEVVGAEELSPLVLPALVGARGAAVAPLREGVRGELGGEVVEGPNPCPSL